MASHSADANEANNFPSTIPELLKILPKRETTLQIRMGNSPVNSSRSHHHNGRNTNNHRNNHNMTNNSLSSSNGPCYHTLRYDFKPASINSEEPASLELTQNGQVTIKAPNVGGSISSQTVFRGQRRPHVKECLLVIDNVTGEMVLQKLTDNITVKATRSLGGSGSGGGSGGPREGGNDGRSSGVVSREVVDRDKDLGGSGSAAMRTAPVLQPLPLQLTTDRGNIGNNSGAGHHSPPIIHNNHHHHHHHSTSTSNNNNSNINSNNLPISRNDGPQLSEDSSSSDDSSSDSSSSSSSSSSSNSGNSSPNNEGFTF